MIRLPASLSRHLAPARRWLAASDAADRLALTLIGSLSLHALALSVHFAMPEPKKHSNLTPPLEVVLVNAKTRSKPNKADALAQANLDGGGNTDADRQARSPLPSEQRDTPPDLQQRRQEVKRLESEAQQLLTQLKAERKSERAPDQPQPRENAQDLPDAADLLERSRQMARLDASIARDFDAYQKKPRRTSVGARTREYAAARYMEDWRIKVERVGNLNYPDEARVKKIHGRLLLTVSVRADGHVENIEVTRSSGHKVLDDAAVRIVRLAAPYAPFPEDLRAKWDILDIVRTWSFTRSDQLDTGE